MRTIRTQRQYRAGQRRKQRSRRLLASVLIALLVLGGLGAVLQWDTRRNATQEVAGVSRTVEQEEDVILSTKLMVDEPLFTLQLPSTWKEVERRSDHHEQSITWQATIKGKDNRWFKVYYDAIPSGLDFNKLLPVDPIANGLQYRQLSENCKNFTTARSGANQPLRSRWDNVEFICDLASFNDNRIGTGTAGRINGTKITGPRQGEHTYLFAYIDRNIQPDYSIFYDALKSFQAK
jgi:hypothetical protein